MLTAEEVRVLGSLIEKEITTPEYYPLTLNALVNACNQKSNRDPVVAYDEHIAQEALQGLRRQSLALEIHQAGSRVVKFGHRVGETWNMGRREIALMCVLMLRGPQTPGELRDRTGRMHEFADIEEVEIVLNKLIEREPAMVAKLPLAPGTKEHRYAHLLSGEPAAPAVPSPRALPDTLESATLREEVAQLRAELAALRLEVDNIKQQLGI